MKIIKASLVAFSVMLLTLFSSCTYRNTEDILGSICDTSGIKYSTYIQNTIQTHCNSESGCHGVSAGSISLESYTQVTENGVPTDILSRIKSGNMPKGAAKLDDCTISKIEKWVNDGAPNN